MNSILVVRFSSLGDIILSEPVVRALRREKADSEISFLTKTRFLPVLEMFEGLDHVYGLPENGSLDAIITELRNQGVDLIVDLHRNLRSSRLKLKLRVRSTSTRKEWWQRFSSVKLKRFARKPSHSLDRYFSALRQISIQQRPLPPALSLPQVYADWWRAERQSRGIGGQYYVIAAGAAHDTKMAPAELWAELSEKLRVDMRAEPVLVGAPDEREILLGLARVLGLSVKSVVTEEHICRAAAALAAARFVLSNDSGLSHLAAGFGIPTLALFGPTHPVLGFAPLGDRAGYYTVNEYCSPCSLHGSKPCFREQRYCFTRMDSDEIIAKIKSLASG